MGERIAVHDRVGVGCRPALRSDSLHRVQHASVCALAGVIACVMLLTACTHGADPTTAMSSAAAPTSTQRPGPPSTTPTTPAGNAAAARHLLDGCAQARPITTAFSGQRDLVIAPLSYAGLKAYATAPVQRPNWNGGYFYKTGAQLRPGVSVTVSIADDAAQYAAIVTENAPAGGARSVTYQSCTKPGTDGFWWVGGLVLWNRKSACVPVDVTTPGEPSGRRVVVSLGAGTCH